MSWVELVGSIAGILFLAGIAWALGLGGGGIGDEAQACAAAEDALSGFEAVEALVSEGGAAAVVRGAEGRLALLKLHGAHVACREVRKPLDIWEGPTGVAIGSGERRFGAVDLIGVRAHDVRLLETSASEA